MRPFALVRTVEQWRACTPVDTVVDDRATVVELAWEAEEAGRTPGAVPSAAGLAFDAVCRLYHSLPEEGRVERLLWAAIDPIRPSEDDPQPVDLLDVEPAARLGDFVPTSPSAGGAGSPRALVVDDDDRLFVADTAAGCVLVYDLWSRRLLRRVRVGAPGEPRDFALWRGRVLVLIGQAPALLSMTAHGEPEPLDLLPAIGTPSRLGATTNGGIVVLADAGTPTARIVACDGSGVAQDVPYATDVEFDGDGALVVAARPGEAFRSFIRVPTQWHELPPMIARAYDGRGVVRTPNGRIAYWTAHGLRTAVRARLRYERDGRVTTFQLDSGEYQTVWGRLFVDACVPPGAEIAVAAFASDEEASAAPTFVDGTFHPLYRRTSGREIPWAAFDAGDRFLTYEAPTIAPMGRYLWVCLRLAGNTHVTPRIRCLRAEHPTHDYLKRLPRIFSRDLRVADFLQRYLALFEGFLGDLEGRASERAALVDPRGTPPEALRWLASFVGLVLDERWPESACRTLIEEAVRLFRFRGTVWGLKRFIEIYTRVPITIVEQFRLRGLGGAMLGDRGALFSSAVVGGGFRVGGVVSETGEAPLAGSVDDAFRTHAHRFSVIVPAALTTEQEEVVTHILEEHRPAHTIFELCTVGAGIRVGRGLHVGLSSVIGRTGGFAPLMVGESVLGRGAVVGRPVAATHAGVSRLGKDSRVG